MLKYVAKLDHGLTYFEKPVMFLFGLLLFGIMCWVVVARFILNIPTAYQTELTKLFHLWMCFVGGSYLIHTNGHPAVEIFPDRIKAKASPFVRKLYFSLIYLIIFAFVATLFYQAVKMIPLYKRQVTTYLYISYIYIYGGGIVGMGLMSLRCLIKLVYVWGGEDDERR